MSDSRIRSKGSDSAIIFSVSCHSYVATFAPGFPPRIFHNPIVIFVLCSIADNDHCMVYFQSVHGVDGRYSKQNGRCLGRSDRCLGQCGRYLGKSGQWLGQSGRCSYKSGQCLSLTSTVSKIANRTIIELFLC